MERSGGGKASAGFCAGAVAGGLWGWFGADGYEAVDSAVGTGFLGALAGRLTGAIAFTVADRRARKRR